MAVAPHSRLHGAPPPRGRTPGQDLMAESMLRRRVRSPELVLHPEFGTPCATLHAGSQWLRGSSRVPGSRVGQASVFPRADCERRSCPPTDPAPRVFAARTRRGNPLTGQTSLATFAQEGRAFRRGKVLVEIGL